MNYQAIRDFLTDFFKGRLAEERLRVAEVGRMDEWRRMALRNTRDFSKDALETKCYLLEGTDESIDTLIEMNDLPLTKGTPQYEMLRTEYLKALPAYVRDMFAIDAEYEEYDFSSEPAAKQAAPSKPSRKAVPLGKAIQEYTEEKLRLKQWRSSTVLDYQGKFDLLVEYLGEGADAEIADDVALEIKQMLLRLPARRKTIPALEKLSIAEQIEASASYPRLTPSSVNQYIQAYSGFYGWLKKRKQVTNNPFKDLMDDTSKTKQQREEFTLDQVQAIIKIALDTKKAYRKWGVLIAAYTGARLNEISQLDVADVIEAEGVPCISFTDEGDDNKRLKNAASKRIVPIHSQLIDYGFLEYVKQRKEENSPNTKLFKELSYDPKNGYGRALGRWVREDVLDKQLGIKGKGTVFHSFRNTVVTFLRNAGVQEANIFDIVGHTQQTVTFKIYGRNLDKKVMQAAIEKLDYKLPESQKTASTS